MVRRACACALLFAALFVPGGPVCGDVVLYRETFGNDYVGAENYRDPADYQWQCCYGGFGLPVDAWTGGAPEPTYHQSVTNEPGRPQDLDNVNAGAAWSQANGFWAYGQVWPYDAVRLLVFTDEFTIDRSTWSVTAIDWYQGNDNDEESPLPAESRVAVCIGGQWYASTETFTNDDVPAGQFPTSANVAHHVFLFTTAATAWRPLIFDPGTEFQLTLDEQLSAPLPSGEITAFGLYIRQQGSDYQAFDTFQVQGLAVPEPAAAALLAAGLGAVLRRRRLSRAA